MQNVANPWLLTTSAGSTERAAAEKWETVVAVALASCCAAAEEGTEVEPMAVTTSEPAVGSNAVEYAAAVEKEASYAAASVTELETDADDGVQAAWAESYEPVTYEAIAVELQTAVMTADAAVNVLEICEYQLALQVSY